MSKLQAVLTLTAVLTIGNIAQAQSGSRNSYPSPAPAPAITNGYTPAAPANDYRYTPAAPASDYGYTPIAPANDYGYSRYPAQDDYVPAASPFGQEGGQPGQINKPRRPCRGAHGDSSRMNYDSRDTYTPARRDLNINRPAGSYLRDDYRPIDREFPGYDYGSDYRPSRDYGNQDYRNQDYGRDLRSRDINRRPRTDYSPGIRYPSSTSDPGYSYTGTGRISNAIRWQTDLKPAAEYARQNRRPMIITVTAPWCSYCKKLESETFRDAGFIRSVNAAQYVSVQVDSDANRELVSRMGIRNLPTTLIVSPDLRIVERMEGFRTAEQLSQSLRRHARTALKDSSIKVAKK